MSDHEHLHEHEDEHDEAHEHGPLAELVTVRDWLRFAVTRFNRVGIFCGHGVADTYDEAVWLLGARHYRQDSEYAFAWNEWERLSLEAADGDPAWQERIRAFWDRHLPIANSVRTGYAYVAFSLDEACFVVGREPEFEETRRVAGGLDELHTLLAEPASELRF